jgi:hypothetical protein
LEITAAVFGANTSATYAANQQGTGGTVTVTDGAHNGNITVLGQYSSEGFQVNDDHHNGTVITYHG